MDKKQQKLFGVFSSLKLVLMLLLTVAAITVTAEPQKTYRVLILNSSNSQTPASNQIVQGIIDILGKASPNIVCYTEFLDSASFSKTPELEALLLKYLKLKYPGKFFDFAVVTDDISYQFFLKNHRKFLYQTPVVFCGVNNFSRNQVRGINNITGIIQRTDSLPLLQLALRQNPWAEDLWIICDSTPAGQSVLQSIAHALNVVKAEYPKLKVNYLLGQNISTRELIKKMRSCSSRGIAIVGPWTKNFQGVQNPFNRKVYQQLSASAKVPLYGFGERSNGDDFVSCRINSNYNIGNEAAYIILELVSGTPISQIRIDSRDNRQFVFNWKQLQYWKISQDNLPAGAKIINKPHSFYDKYRPYILLSSGALLIQALVIILLFINIYHRNRLRRELQESEQRLRKALDLVPHVIMAVDINDNILLANRTAAEVFNIDLKNIAGSNLRQIYGPPGLAKLLRDNHGTFEQDEPCLMPNMAIRDETSGMLYEYSLTRSPFPFGNNRAAVLLCVVDNTALRESEQERRQNEELYRNIFENSEGGILFANLENMQAVHANPAFCKMLGYHHDEIIKLGIKDFYPLELHGIIGNATNQLRNSSAVTKHFTALPVLRKDGMLIFADITAGTIMLDGQKCMVAFFVDVTERQKIENELVQWKDRLELALNSSRLGMWDWFLNTNMTQVNDTMLDILGVTREEFSNEYGFIKNFIHHEDLPVVKQALSAHLNGGAGLYEVEFRINRNYRKWIWLQLIGKVVKSDRRGKPERMIGFVQDITERKNFEDELRRAKERAEESDRLKSSFLANMSHEIRTPLNAISGFANLVNDKTLSDDKLEEYTQLICKSSEQLLKIISDILDLSKIENRQLELNNAPLKLDEVLHSIYHIFAARAAHEHGDKVELRLVMPPVLSQTVIFADESRLIQVFTNLLGNAMKFTADGYIEFGYQLCAPEILFYVKDTGTGIPAEKHELIFEEFAQADNTITKQYGGTGLGLSICRQLVNLMGGRIWLESKPGHGSTFFFALPENRPS
ncbi:MAG: PAS domain S-box protein [Victivallaceae bacterium]|nr:PAS domain S-box protein [Victivallaceae bacterium]